jgi:3-phosphoshikimate 1-carboxyvinyltransferase
VRPKGESALVENELYLAPIRSLQGEVHLPGSKSLSNRVLLLAALCGDGTDAPRIQVENLLFSDDVLVMIEALKKLGIPVQADEGQREAVVTGCGGRVPKRDSPIELHLGNAGTAMRPLTAVLCAVAPPDESQVEQVFVLDGVPRMRERPIQDLVEALQQLGCDVQCVRGTGCPPVRIRRTSAFRGGRASVSGKISSQYLSALLMAAPLAATEDVVLDIRDTLVSVPYVEMTMKLMQKFGVNVLQEHSVDAKSQESRRFVIPAKQRYQPPANHLIAVEGDASSASYFLAGAAITGGDVQVHGCGSESVQGDVRFANVLEQMGATVTWSPNAIRVRRDPNRVLHGVDVDCGDIPDAAMTLAVVALFAQGRTVIRNVYNWRVKETERMRAIVTELSKLGAEVEEGHDYCVIDPPAPGSLRANVSIETYDDHRMAMAFALVACGGVPVRIQNPSCVRKTFPNYFEVLRSVSVPRTS